MISMPSLQIWFMHVSFHHPANLASYEFCKTLLEQPGYSSTGCIPFTFCHLQKNLILSTVRTYIRIPTSVHPRNNRILYYDCTNYYFEIEEAKWGTDDTEKVKKTVQIQSLPWDFSWMPMAFPLHLIFFQEIKNEQTTLKPLESKDT